MKHFCKKNFFMDHIWILLICIAFEGIFFYSWKSQKVPNTVFYPIFLFFILLIIGTLVILFRMDSMSNLIEYCNETRRTMEELDTDCHITNQEAIKIPCSKKNCEKLEQTLTK